MKKFAIVGGGLSGWLTAIHLNFMYKDEAEIIVIEDEKLGTIGVGEGSTPNFVSFLKSVNIDLFDFMKNTNATHKMGVNFINWNGDGKQYFHSFNTEKNNCNYLNYENKFVGDEYVGFLLKNNLNLFDYIVPNNFSLNSDSPYFHKLTDEQNLEDFAYFSFHFDSNLAIKFLSKLAKERGVLNKKSKVIDFKLDWLDNIETIILESGEEIITDFVFDCSGFKRLIIGNLFNDKWISYQNQLTLNRAISFYVDIDEIKIGTHTNAISMKNGWMWQIPLQNRIGCGYIFDSNFVNDSDILEEINDFYAKPVIPNKFIDFKAGRYENSWINNCIAIGISLGFTEPIEATSIYHTICQLAITQKWILDKNNKIDIVTYNKLMKKLQESTLEFLYFHYFVKRNDTQFWKSYIQRTNPPIGIQKKIKKWKTTLLDFDDFNEDINSFKYHNWLSVGIGIDFFDKNLFIKKYEKSKNKSIILKHHQNIKDSIKKISKTILKEDFFKNK